MLPWLAQIHKYIHTYIYIFKNFHFCVCVHDVCMYVHVCACACKLAHILRKPEESSALRKL